MKTLTEPTAPIEAQEIMDPDDGGAFAPDRGINEPASKAENPEMDTPIKAEPEPEPAQGEPLTESNILERAAQVMETQDKKRGSDNFRQMRDKHEAEKATLQAQIEELQKKTADAPEGFDPEWKTKIEQSQQELASYQKNHQELQSKYQEADEKLKVLDLENRPDFKEKYDISVHLDEARSAAEAAGIDPDTVATIFRAKGSERLKLLADIENKAHDNGRNIPNYLLTKIDNALAVADAKESGKQEALKDVATTREQLINQQKQSHLQAEQQTRDRLALEAKFALENTLKLARENEPLFSQGAGQESLNAAVQEIQEGKFSPQNVIDWRMAAAAYPHYKELAVGLLGELERLKGVPDVSDPGGLTAGASISSSAPDSDDGGAFAPHKVFGKN